MYHNSRNNYMINSDALDKFDIKLRQSNKENEYDAKCESAYQKQRLYKLK